MDSKFRFDPIDKQELARWLCLSDTQRIQTMLESREFVCAIIRGDLSIRYPNLPISEMNLKVLEEIERRGKRSVPRFDLVS